MIENEIFNNKKYRKYQHSKSAHLLREIKDDVIEEIRRYFGMLSIHRLFHIRMIRMGRIGISNIPIHSLEGITIKYHDNE